MSPQKVAARAECALVTETHFPGMQSHAVPAIFLGFTSVPALLQAFFPGLPNHKRAHLFNEHSLNHYSMPGNASAMAGSHP